jgi:hypothetical protein
MCWWDASSDTGSLSMTTMRRGTGTMFLGSSRGTAALIASLPLVSRVRNPCHNLRRPGGASLRCRRRRYNPGIGSSLVGTVLRSTWITAYCNGFLTRDTSESPASLHDDVASRKIIRAG